MPDEMFRPPVNRSMKVLDRAFFSKRIPLTAASVLDNRNISKVRADLERSKDCLGLLRYANVQSHPEDKARKCVLLRPEVDDQGHKHPWSQTVHELQNTNVIRLIPYELHLDYKYWNFHDIAQAILPIAEEDDLQSSFQIVGHVAHMNLRDASLPYKHLIGQLILDKNPSIKTVINKIDDVGEENAFRTFKYEVLAGPDDMNVEVVESSCLFKFDYARVYWNSRLHTEHQRLVDLFKEGEAVCDVMAGIGPFAIPAGKKKVFVWANDLNPDSYEHLVSGIQRNKVSSFVRPFNVDGHKFIKSAAEELARSDVEVVQAKVPATRRSRPSHPSDAPEAADASTRPGPPAKTWTRPKVFSHFIMNLPASAIDFVPDFVGLYSGVRDQLPKDVKMPMVHCYCFDTKSDDNVEETKRICAEISKRIGFAITPETPDTTVWDVRDVAPKKRMFCASFRLPEEVAFRDVEDGGVSKIKITP